MKKILIIITIITSTLIEANACESADQYRLFPLGVSYGKVICLELDQFRNPDGSFFDVSWEVRANLISISASGQRKQLNKYTGVKIKDSEYSVKVIEILANACLEAKMDPDFEEFLVSDIDFGEYNNSLEEFTYSVNNKLKPVISNKKRETEVILSELFLKRINAFLDVNPKTKLTDAQVKKDHSMFFKKLGIGSVRKYRSENYELVVACLGFGDRNSRTKNPIDESKIQLVSVDQFMYNEPVLHHGHSFDMLWILKK